MDYQIRGYLKGAFDSLKPTLNVAMPAGKIDRLVFVFPRFIQIMRDGAGIRDEDAVNERPLRSNRMGKDIVALTASEQIDDPWEITFKIGIMPNNSTPKSSAINFERIEKALTYGQLNGLGQWRNASWGRFKWERVED